MNDEAKKPQNEGEKLTSAEKRVKIQDEDQKTASIETPSGKSKRAFKFSRKRDGRVAFKKRRKLSFNNKKDGFYYHWMNEEENDFLQLKNDGYAFVDDKNKEPRDAASPSEDGTIVKRSVGGGKYAYLMCIPQEWKDEYDREKQAENDRVMKSIGKDGLDCIPVSQMIGDVKITNSSTETEE
jgi:hypothetical protein